MCGPSTCGSYRAGRTSIRSSPEAIGMPSCGSGGLGIASVAPSTGLLCGQPPYNNSYRSGSRSTIPITGGAWPASLQQRPFEEEFDLPVVGVERPTSLERLSFGYSLNQPVAGATWPASLRKLSFGYSFDRPVAGVDWPESLKKLSFGTYSFNQRLSLAWSGRSGC